MKGGLRMIYPPQCPCCGAGVTEEDALCPACWTRAEFIAAPCCAQCGVPMAGAEGEDAPVCEGCLARPRPWQRGVAALVYDGAGRDLALTLKHGDRPDLAPVMGRWLARAAGGLVTRESVVVPIPIHPKRLMTRKYNQAALLSRVVARAHGARHLPGALVRERHTPTQDHRSAEARFANVAGALRVPLPMQARIAGASVVVVDDVMASGATLTAATQALLAAGAARVDVAVFARAVLER